MENTKGNNIIVKDKKPTSKPRNALLDEGYMQDMNNRSNKYYAEKRPYDKKKEMNELK